MFNKHASLRLSHKKVLPLYKWYSDVSSAVMSGSPLVFSWLTVCSNKWGGATLPILMTSLYPNGVLMLALQKFIWKLHQTWSSVMCKICMQQNVSSEFCSSSWTLYWTGFYWCNVYSEDYLERLWTNVSIRSNVKAKCAELGIEVLIYS